MRGLHLLSMTVAFAAPIGSAMAQADGLDALFSGTIVETRADGSGGKLEFNRDGSVKVMMGRGPMMGSFTRNEKGDFCLHLTPPPGATPPAGGPQPGRQIPCATLPLRPGQTVDRVGPTGQTEHFQLVEGRQPAAQ